MIRRRVGNCLAALLVAVSAVSCTKAESPVVSVDPGAVNAGSAASEVTLNVVANRSWTATFRSPLDASVTIEWASISETEGESASGREYTTPVVVSVEPNTSAEPRVCELVFHAVGGEFIVPVRQEGAAL